MGAGQQVHLYLYDVDDPSRDPTHVMDTDHEAAQQWNPNAAPGTQNGNKDNNARGEDSPALPPGQAFVELSVVTCTNHGGDYWGESAPLAVSLQPGDNYRVVALPEQDAAVLADYLSALAAKPADPRMGVYLCSAAAPYTWQEVPSTAQSVDDATGAITTTTSAAAAVKASCPLTVWQRIWYQEGRMQPGGGLVGRVTEDDDNGVMRTTVYFHRVYNQDDETGVAEPLPSVGQEITIYDACHEDLTRHVHDRGYGPDTCWIELADNETLPAEYRALGYVNCDLDGLDNPNGHGLSVSWGSSLALDHELMPLAHADAFVELRQGAPPSRMPRRFVPLGSGPLLGLRVDWCALSGGNTFWLCAADGCGDTTPTKSGRGFGVPRIALVCVGYILNGAYTWTNKDAAVRETLVHETGHMFDLNDYPQHPAELNWAGTDGAVMVYAPVPQGQPSNDDENDVARHSSASLGERGTTRPSLRRARYPLTVTLQ